MKILISNDDGIFAPGVRALASAISRGGHQVMVVCPDQERSATGHGITMNHPIRAEAIDSLFDVSVKAWSCSGTPADCVKLAIWALLESPPDLVISGINQGQNLGTDVLYSGTVSAAMEGLIEGIPSIAISLASYTGGNFQPAAEFAIELVNQFQQQPFPMNTLLNVNVPAVSAEEIAGVIFTRQGVRRYEDIFQKRVDPRGRTYYWLAGEAIEDVEQTPDPLLGDEILTDVQGIERNYITITPLQYNLTNREALSMSPKWKFSFPSPRSLTQN